MTRGVTDWREESPSHPLRVEVSWPFSLSPTISVCEEKRGQREERREVGSELLRPLQARGKAMKTLWEIECSGTGYYRHDLPLSFSSLLSSLILQHMELLHLSIAYSCSDSFHSHTRLAYVWGREKQVHSPLSTLLEDNEQNGSEALTADSLYPFRQWLSLSLHSSCGRRLTFFPHLSSLVL